MPRCAAYYRRWALARGDAWIFGPETPYERSGDVGNVTFPCGYTIGADGDSLDVYYGAADTSIALATASIKELLRWLDAQWRCHASGELLAATRSCSVSGGDGNERCEFIVT